MDALGWYNAGEGAGLIGATVGAIIVLLIWVPLSAGGGATHERQAAGASRFQKRNKFGRDLSRG